MKVKEIASDAINNGWIDGQLYDWCLNNASDSVSQSWLRQLVDAIRLNQVRVL